MNSFPTPDPAVSYLLMSSPNPHPQIPSHLRTKQVHKIPSEGSIAYGPLSRLVESTENIVTRVSSRRTKSASASVSKRRIDQSCSKSESFRNDISEFRLVGMKDSMLIRQLEK